MNTKIGQGGMNKMEKIELIIQLSKLLGGVIIVYFLWSINKKLKGCKK